MLHQQFRSWGHNEKVINMSHIMTKTTKMACVHCENSDQSSLTAGRKLGSLATHWVHSEDSDQTTGPGWSEFSLDAQSFCWFCHEAARIPSALNRRIWRICTVKILTIRNPKKCCNYPKIWTMWLYHRVISPKDVDGIANRIDPDQRSSLIWVYTVCPDLSVRNPYHYGIWNMYTVSLSVCEKWNQMPGLMLGWTLTY